MLDDIQQNDDSSYDLPTRFALDWFEQACWEAQPSGHAILVANARNIPLAVLVRSGIVIADAGRVRLTRREEMKRPAHGATPPIWSDAQQLARALTAADGGHDSAARVMARLADREAVRALVYRLYALSDRRGRAAEALVWNRVAEEWRSIADRVHARRPATTQDLFELRA